MRPPEPDPLPPPCGRHKWMAPCQMGSWGLVMEQTQEVNAYVKRPNFYKADYDLVRNKLKEKNLESAIRGMNVNDAWKKFNGIMWEIIEKNIPNYKRTNKRRPWVTREVQKKRRAKNKAWKKFRKLKEEIRLSCENEARLENLNRNYVKKRNSCNDANRAAIKNFEQKLSRNVKEDSKSFYNYVRSKQKRKERVGPLKKDVGNEEVIVD